MRAPDGNRTMSDDMIKKIIDKLLYNVSLYEKTVEHNNFVVIVGELKIQINSMLSPLQTESVSFDLIDLKKRATLKILLLQLFAIFEPLLNDDVSIHDIMRIIDDEIDKRLSEFRGHSKAK